MTFQQLSAKLRQIRSQMPRVTSERAYAQMDLLMGQEIFAKSKPNELEVKRVRCAQTGLR